MRNKADEEQRDIQTKLERVRNQRVNARYREDSPFKRQRYSYGLIRYHQSCYAVLYSLSFIMFIIVLILFVIRSKRDDHSVIMMLCDANDSEGIRGSA